MLNKIKNSDSFFANVLKLAGGSAAAQGIAILAAPFLTRIYGPEAYGISTLFASITGAIGVIACLRYELAIMLPERDENAAGILAASIAFVSAVALTAFLMAAALHSEIASVLKAPELEKYLWLVPLMVLASGTFLALNYWNSRTKEFGRLAVTRIFASAGTVATQLGTGLGGKINAGGLIGGQIAGQAISTALLGYLIWKKDHKILMQGFKWSKIKEGIKRYKRFPLIDTWSALLNTASAQLPSFLLAYFFSPKIVGYYALSANLLSMPASLVGAAFAQVFYQKAAEAKRNNTLHVVTEKTFNSLVSLGMFPILLLAVAGKEIVILVFGANWAEAGVYTQILSVWIFFNFLTSPISTLFSVLEKQPELLLFNNVLFMVRCSSLIIGGMLNSPVISLVLFSLSNALVYFLILIIIFIMIGVPVKNCSEKLKKDFILVFIFITIIYFIKVIIKIRPEYLVYISFLFAILYYLFILPKITNNL